MPAKLKIKVNVLTSEGKTQTHQSLEYSHLMKQALDKTLDDMHSQIDLAIDKEDIEQLKQLLSMDSITLMAGAKVRINKGAPSNVIPISFDPVEVLSTAVEESKPKVVDFLLNEYCKPSSKKKISENDLHLIFAINAMKQKNTRILLSLTQHGANPNLSGSVIPDVGDNKVTIEGSIALANAILLNNIPAIEFLLGRTAPPITRPVDLKKWRDNHHNSALQLAIKFCKETVAIYFIDNKLVDLENVNFMGHTALLMTIPGKQRHIFDKLKAAKASFHYLDDFKLNALEIMMNYTKFNTELLRVFLYNKINLWLADIKLTLTEQKKSQINIITKIIIQKLLIIDISIGSTHGNIYTEATFDLDINFLPGERIQMTKEEKREFNSLKKRKSFTIVLGKKELIEITQELLKEYQDDERYLLEKCYECILKTSSEIAQYQKELIEFFKKWANTEDKTHKMEWPSPAAQRLLLDEINTSVDNALKPFSTGSESDIHKKIVKILHENNFHKVEGQICFKGSPIIMLDRDNKDSSEQEYTFSNEQLLSAIKESYTIYKTNPNQDLKNLVLLTLAQKSNEFNALYKKMIDNLAEKFLHIKNNHCKNLSDFDKRLSDFNLSLGNAKFQIETLSSALIKFEKQMTSGSMKNRVGSTSSSESGSIASASSSSTTTGHWAENTPLSPSSNNLIFSNTESRTSEGLFDNLGERKKSKDVDDQAKSVILGHLATIEYEMGNAVSKGDCFFDAVGQGLLRRNIAIPAEYQGQFVYKRLRQLCEKYAKSHQKDNAHWLKMQLAKEHQNYLMTVGYTAPEVEEMWKQHLLPSGVACWGRPDIDGRIICAALKVKLHVIELMVVENQVVLAHQLIDANGSKQLIDDKEIREIYNDNRVVHLVGYQNALHWVPILTKLAKDKNKGTPEASLVSQSIVSSSSSSSSSLNPQASAVPLPLNFGPNAQPITSSYPLESSWNQFSLREAFESSFDSDVVLFPLSNNKNQVIVTKQVESVKQAQKITRSYTNSSRLTENITIQSSEGIREALARFTGLSGKESQIYWYMTHMSILRKMLEMAQKEDSCKDICISDLNYVIERSSHSSSFFTKTYEDQTKIIRIAIKILSYLAQNKVELSEGARKSLIENLNNKDEKAKLYAVWALIFAINNGQSLHEKEVIEQQSLEIIANTITGLMSTEKQILSNLPLIVIGLSALAKKRRLLSEKELSILQRSLVYIGNKVEVVSSFYPNISFTLEFHPTDRKSIFNRRVTEFRNFKKIVRENRGLLSKDELLYTIHWAKNETDPKLKGKAIQILRYAIENRQGIFEEPNTVMNALKEASRDNNRKTKNAALIALGCLEKNQKEEKRDAELREYLNHGLTFQRKFALSAISHFLRLHGKNKLIDTATWLKILRSLENNRSREDQTHEIANTARFLIYTLENKIGSLVGLLKVPSEAVKATAIFLGAIQQNAGVDDAKILAEVLNNLFEIITSDKHHADAKYNVHLILRHIVEHIQIIAGRHDGSLLSISKFIQTLINASLQSSEPRIVETTLTILGSYAAQNVDAILGDLVFTALSKALLANNKQAYIAAFALRNILEYTVKILPKCELAFEKIFSDIIKIIRENSPYETETKTKSALMLVFLQAANKGFNFSEPIILVFVDNLDKNKDPEIQVRTLETIKLIVDRQNKVSFPDKLILALLDLLNENTIRQDDVTYILMLYIKKVNNPFSKNILERIEKLLNNADNGAYLTDILRTMVAKDWRLPDSLLGVLSNFLTDNDIDARSDAAWIFNQIIDFSVVSNKILAKLYQALEAEKNSENLGCLTNILMKSIKSNKESSEFNFLSLDAANKLAEIMKDLSENISTKMNVANILEHYAGKNNYCLRTETIALLTNLILEPNNDLCKVVISILCFQMNQLGIKKIQNTREVKAILVNIEKKIKERALFGEMLSFLKIANRQKYKLASSILEGLVDILFLEPNQHVRKLAVEILDSVSPCENVSKRIATVIQLERNTLLLNNKQISNIEFKKVSEKLLSIIKTGSYVTQNNFLIFDEFLHDYSPKMPKDILGRMTTIAEIIYCIALNGQILPNYVLEKLADSLKFFDMFGQCALSTLAVTAQHSHFIPVVVFNRVDTFFHDYNHTSEGNNTYTQCFLLIELAAKRNILISSKTIEKFLDILNKNNVDIIVRRMASKIIYQLTENFKNQENIDSFVEKIMTSIPLNQEDGEIIKFLSLSFKAITLKYVFNLNEKSVRQLINALNGRTSFDVVDNIIHALAKLSTQHKLSEEINEVIQLKQAEHIVLDSNKNIAIRIDNIYTLRRYGKHLSKAFFEVIGDLLLHTMGAEERKKLLSSINELQKNFVLSYPVLSLDILEKVVKIWLDVPNESESKNCILGALVFKRNIPDAIVKMFIQALHYHENSLVRDDALAILIQLDQYQSLSFFYKGLITSEQDTKTIDDTLTSSKKIDEKKVIQLIARLKLQESYGSNILNLFSKILAVDNVVLQNKIISFLCNIKFTYHPSANENLFSSLMRFVTQNKKVDHKEFLSVCQQLLNSPYFSLKKIQESIQVLEIQLTTPHVSMLGFKLLKMLIKRSDAVINNESILTTINHLLLVRGSDEKFLELLSLLSLVFKQEQPCQKIIISRFIEVISEIMLPTPRNVAVNRFIRLNTNSVQCSNNIKIKLFRLFGYLYRKQTKDFNNVDVLYQRFSGQLLKCINFDDKTLQKLEYMHVNKRFNFLLNAIFIKYKSTFSESSHPDFYSRDLLKTDLLLRTTQENQKISVKEMKQLYEDALIQFEITQNFNFYSEERDNILTLLIEKQENEKLNLNAIVELLLILNSCREHPVKFLIHCGADFKSHWLKNIVLDSFPHSNLSNDSIQKIQSWLNKLNWPTNLINMFFLNIRETQDISKLHALFEFLSSFEVNPEDIFDVLKEMSGMRISLNEFDIIVKKQIVLGVLSKVMSLFFKHHFNRELWENNLPIVENIRSYLPAKITDLCIGYLHTDHKTLSDPILHVEKLITHRVVELLNLNWSFETLYKIIANLEAKFKNNQFINMEQFSVLFDIAYCYKISGQEFEKLYEKMGNNLDVKIFHEFAISKLFKNKGDEKNPSTLLKELMDDNNYGNGNGNGNDKNKNKNKNKNHNTSLLKLIEEDTLNGILEKMNRRYETKIKKWGKNDIQLWQQRVKKQLSEPAMLPEILAVVKRACYLHNKYEPRNIQMIAVLTLLFRQSSQGRFLQVATGEGKSIIIAMLAVIKALQGEIIDVVTSSPGLARRDSENYQAFYELFNLKVGCNGEQHYVSGLKKCYANDVKIIYGYINDFQFDYLRHEHSGLGTRGDRKFGVVIVDEADNLLIDEGAKIAMLANAMPGLDSLKPILVLIWLELERIDSGFVSDKNILYYHEGNKQGVKIGFLEDKTTFINFIVGKLKVYVEKITKSNNEFNLVVAKHLNNFLTKQIDNWIQNAVLAHYKYKLGKEYTIRRDSHSLLSIMPVDFANTGTVQNGTSWGDGLHQFIQIKHGLEITSETLIVNFISNMAYIGLYEDKLCGLTGTLGSLEARNLLAEIYKIDFVYIPNYKEPRFEELPSIINLTEIEWVEEIAVNASREAKNGRVVLIVCETMNQANTIYLRLFPDSDLHIQRYIGNEDEQDQFLKAPQEENTVIIATNLAGRGTDIKVSSSVETRGGLHVCFTFLPSNLRVEEQGFRRAGRQGQPGTAQLILTQKEIVTKLGHCEDLSSIDLFNIQAIRQVRDQVEKKHLAEIRQKKLPQTRNKDNLYKEFRALVKTLSELEKDQDAFQYKKKAIEERWGSWLKEQDIENVSGTALQAFKLFQKTLVDEYRTDTVIKNPYYYINEGVALLSYASSFKGKLLRLGRTTALYTKAIELFDKAIALDPIHCYMAHYNKIYALIQITPNDYKKLAKEAANKVIQIVSDYFLEQVSAITQLLNNPNKKISDDYYKELFNQFSCKIQILQILLQSSRGIVEEIERSQKLMDLQCFVGNEILCFSKLDRNQILVDPHPKLKAIQNNAQYSISFHGLRASPDLKVHYQAENTIKQMPNQAKVSITFSEFDLVNAGHDKKIIKYLLAINRKLQEEHDAQEEKKKKEELGQKTENVRKVGTEENLRHYANAAYEKIDGFARSAGDVIKSGISGIKKLIDFDDAFYKQAGLIPVTVELEIANPKDVKRYLDEMNKKIERDIKNVCEESMVEVSFNNASKTFLEQISKFFVLHKPVFNRRKYGESNGRPYYSTCVVPQLNEESNLFTAHFKDLAFQKVESLLSAVEQSIKQIKEVDAINFPYKNMVIRFPHLTQMQASSILDIQAHINPTSEVSKGLVTLHFECLGKEDALKIIYLTEKYNKDAVFCVKGLNSTEVHHMVKSADLEEEDLSIFTMPIENVLSKLNNSKTELMECQTNGFVNLFSIKELNARPWWNIGLLACLGAIQIAGGILLTGFTGGLAINFGAAFVSEGLGDLLRMANAFYYREFSWTSYLLQKSVSLAISFTTAGIAYGNASAGAAKVAGKMTETTNSAITVTGLAGDLMDEAAFQAAVLLRDNVIKNGFQMAGYKVLQSTIQVSAMATANLVLDTVSNYGLDQITERMVNLINNELKSKMKGANWEVHLNKIHTSDKFLEKNVNQTQLIDEVKGMIETMHRDPLGIKVVSQEIMSEFEKGFTKVLVQVSKQVEPFHVLLFRKFQPRLDIIAAKEIGQILVDHNILMSDGSINLGPTGRIDSTKLKLGKYEELYKQDIIGACESYSQISHRGHSYENDVLRHRITELFAAQISVIFAMLLGMAKKGVSRVVSMGVSSATKGLTETHLNADRNYSDPTNNRNSHGGVPHYHHRGHGSHSHSHWNPVELDRERHRIFLHHSDSRGNSNQEVPRTLYPNAEQRISYMRKYHIETERTKIPNSSHNHPIAITEGRNIHGFGSRMSDGSQRTVFNRGGGDGVRSLLFQRDIHMLKAFNLHKHIGLPISTNIEPTQGIALLKEKMLCQHSGHHHHASMQLSTRTYIESRLTLLHEGVHQRIRDFSHIVSHAPSNTAHHVTHSNPNYAFLMSSFTIVQQTLINDYQLYLMRRCAEDENVIRAAYSKYTKSNLEILEKILEDHRKFIKLLITLILHGQEFNSDLSNLKYSNILALPVMIEKEKTQNVLIEKKATHIFDEYMKNVMKKDKVSKEIMKKEIFQFKNIKNSVDFSVNSNALLILLEDTLSKFYQLLEECKMAKEQSEIIGGLQSLSGVVGEYFGNLKGQKYSECGQLLKSGKLGESGYVFGTLIEGIITANNNSQLYHHTTQMMLGNIMKNIVEGQNTFEKNLIGLQGKYAKLTEDIIKFNADKMNEINKIGESFDKIIEQAAAADSKFSAEKFTSMTVYYTARANNLQKQLESYYTTSMEIVKANAIDPNFIKVCIEMRKAMTDSLSEAIKSVAKEQSSTFNTLVTKIGDLCIEKVRGNQRLEESKIQSTERITLAEIDNKRSAISQAPLVFSAAASASNTSSFSQSSSSSITSSPGSSSSPSSSSSSSSSTTVPHK